MRHFAALSAVSVIFLASAASAYAANANCKVKGLTWDRASINSTTGTVDVGCHGNVGGYDCNPYQGDTSCNTALPILCIKKDTAAFPLPTHVDNSNQYHKWASGVVGTTVPVNLCTANVDTIQAANKLCEAEFGNGWRVAEHHDGWGWHFQAFGNVGNPSKRFWVNVTDQPKGTCWKN